MVSRLDHVACQLAVCDDRNIRARGGLALLLVRQRRAAIFESMARSKKRRGGGSHHIFRHAERFEHDDIHGAFPPKSVITDIIAFPAEKTKGKRRTSASFPPFVRLCFLTCIGFGANRRHPRIYADGFPKPSLYRYLYVWNRKSFLFSARLPASLSTSRSPARSRRCPPAASPDKTAARAARGG